MNPYRENKVHTLIIKVMLAFAAVIFLVEALLKKENPAIVSYSENSHAYYLGIFGFCSACYALSMLLVYLAGMSVDKPGGKYQKPKLWEQACSCLGVLLWLVGLPASVVFGGLHSLYSRRLTDGIERDKNKEWQERYDHTPCPHCGMPRVTKEPEFWEDTEYK